MIRVEQLEELSNADLQAEFVAMGIPEDPGMKREDYVQRLRAICSWNDLSSLELQQECERRKISACHLKQLGDKDGRCELVALLITDLRFDYLERLGIPSRQIGNTEMAANVAEQLQRLPGQTTEDLKSDLDKFALPVQADMSRDDFEDAARKLYIWHALPTSELQKECKAKHISTEGLLQMREADRRHELLERLKVAAYASPYVTQGVPVARLGSLEAAAKVAKEWQRLKEDDVESLRQECANLGLELEDGLERTEIVARLSEVAVWKELPLKELSSECRKHDMLTASRAGLNSGTAARRQELFDRLLLAASFKVFEIQGIPAKKINSTKGAARVADEWQRINCATLPLLTEEYQKLSLPHKVEPSRSQIVERLRAIALWQELPIAELRKECKALNITVWSELPRGTTEKDSAVWKFAQSPYFKSGIVLPQKVAPAESHDERNELVQRMLTSFLPDLEAVGIPARRLAPVQKVSKVVDRWKQLQEMTFVELHAECQKLGVPAGDRPKIKLDRLKTLSLWQEFPISELEKELESYRLPTTGTHAGLLRRLIEKAFVEEVSKSEQQNRQFGASTAPAASGRQKHLKLLGLTLDASDADIRKAYHQLALKHHPDKNLGERQEEAARMFREVAKAYEALCDDSRSG